MNSFFTRKSSNETCEKGEEETSDNSIANTFTRPGTATSTPSSDLKKNNDNTLHNAPESAVTHYVNKPVLHSPTIQIQWK